MSIVLIQKSFLVDNIELFFNETSKKFVVSTSSYVTFLSKSLPTTINASEIIQNKIMESNLSI